jgi:hypothetical protein
MTYKFVNCTDIEELVLGKVEYSKATTKQSMEEFIKSTMKLDKIYCRLTGTEEGEPDTVSIAFGTTKTPEITFVWWSGDVSLEDYKNDIVSYIEEPIEIPQPDLIEYTMEIQSGDRELLTFVTDSTANVSYIL